MHSSWCDIKCLLLAVGFMLSCLMSTNAFACPYSIRQVGFVPLKGDTYHVYCIINDDTPDGEQVSRLFKASAKEILKHSNVKADVVNIDRQKNHRALTHLRSLNLKVLPRLILVSPRNEVMVLPKVNIRSEESLWRQLKGIVSSPKREELKKHIAKNWCVVVLIEGQNEAENKRATKAIEVAIEQITGAMTQMGTIVERGPHLLRITPDEMDEEAIMLWSLGLPRVKRQHAQAIVLFGRGRQMGAVLTGRSITTERMLKIFHTLGRNCTCTTDLKAMLGRVLPLKWDYSIQEEIRQEIGFDPNDPEVRASLAVIGSLIDSPGNCNQAVLGYTEEYMEFDESVDTSTSQPPTITLSTANVNAMETASPLHKRISRVVIITFAVMTLLVFIGSALLIVRRRNI